MERIDRILTGGEITSQGEFTLAKKGAFLLFLSPKTETYNVAEVLSCKVSDNDDMTDFPVIVGLWSPVIFNKVNVTAELLQNYRVFWGAD